MVTRAATIMATESFVIITEGASLRRLGAVRSHEHLPIAASILGVVQTYRNAGRVDD